MVFSVIVATHFVCTGSYVISKVFSRELQINNEEGRNIFSTTNNVVLVLFFLDKASFTPNSFAMRPYTLQQKLQNGLKRAILIKCFV